MAGAGLPGTGLGGIFYVVLALVMPLIETYRTLRGRGTRARWGLVMRQFSLACGIVAAMATAITVSIAVLGRPGTTEGTDSTLLLAPGLLAACLLTLVVVILRIWARCLRASARSGRDEDRVERLPREREDVRP